MKLMLLNDKQVVWPDGRDESGFGRCWLNAGVHRMSGEDAHWIRTNYGYDRSVRSITLDETEPGDSVGVARDMGLGDVLMTTPTIRLLAERGLQIHYWTLARYLPLLEHNPQITALHDLGTPTATPDMADLDIAIQLRKSVEMHPAGNSANRTRLFAECVGVSLNGDDRTPDYFATRDELARGEERWGPGRPRVALVVRASNHNRTWSHMRALSEALAAEGVICGIFDHDPDACWSDDKVLDFGGLPLREVIATIAVADLCVSHDTGLLYAAVAVGTPVVALFGCWPPPLRLEGYRNVSVFDANAILGRGYCHDGGPCDGSQLNAITVEAVTGAVKEAVR